MRPLIGSILLIALWNPAFAGMKDQRTPPPTPMILDTDIGGDIDDAFALALALRSPELDLVGVTTVSGDTAGRARIAAKMLSEAGRTNVPVYAGPPGKHLPCAQCGWAEDFQSPELHYAGAVDFLENEFNSRPGELTLVPIGPLTNVAALLKRDPAVARKIKRIVLMGGSIHLGYAPGSPAEPEYNIAADVPAAQAVFASGIPIVMAPLDVTAMLQLGPSGRDRIFSRPDPLSKALRDLYGLWGKETPILFDPQAIALIYDPSLCQTERLHIKVDARGMTVVFPGKPANARVALKTNPGRFLDFYLKRVAP